MFESVRTMLNVQTSEEQTKVTIVDAVYRTVVTNGIAFQRQVQEKQQEERQAEAAERKQELRAKQAAKSDVLELNKQAQEMTQAQTPAPAPEAPAPEPAPEPSRGQTVDAVA